MTPEVQKELISLAIKSRQIAYAPYSNFLVGAALLTADGSIYTGCNVENTSYGLCICAERTAICKAVSEGHQEFQAIAVAANPFATPCGACRQFIVEFGKQIEVIAVDANNPEHVKTWAIEDLIPENFKF
ncbi:MAG: cytidine deaminase [Mariniblastus sp.]|jgi:cytidine deaminase|nr:cytidine deaminase [bacterium]MDC0284559.1 cytidine deaminase [Mariniblastus sp.]MDG1514013.1 cytidine deaminase [Mariniblastus sp.]MDG2182148.1 cytidine deaminase [Mariniblastus sp.]